MAYYLDWGGRSNDVRVELASPIILAGDFSLSVSFSSSTNGSFIASGGTSTGGLEFYRNNSGRLQVFLSGSSRFSGSSAISNDKSSPSNLIIERVGAQVSFTLDGALQGSIIEGGDLYISTIGERPNGGWVRSPEMSLYSLIVQGQHDYSPSASNGTGQLIDTKGGNHGTPVNFSDFEAALIYYDDGSSEPEPETEIHEFSGSAVVNASTSASAHKAVSLSGNAQVTALSQSSLSKLAEFSGQSAVNVSSVSLFEKVTTFTGAATVDVTSQSAFSKRVAFSGESTVDVTASGVLFDENFEIHTFAGGATISATASGQAIKVGLVSGESRVDATSSAQAQKVASLSGNAQVNLSTQSAFSKLASLAGNAIARITTAATITKRVLLNGASTVLARASGTFFNTDSNVETYETTIEGRVKAPLVVKGTVKSITIQGRVK